MRKQIDEYCTLFAERHEWLKQLTSSKNDSGSIASRIEPVYGKSGALTWRIETYDNRKVFLHSQYDPVQEARKWAVQEGITTGDSVLTFGVGLGYHIAALLDCVGPTGELWVFETDTAIMKQSLEQRDWDSLLQHPALHVILESNPVKLAIQLVQKIDHVLGRDGRIAIFPPMLRAISPEHDSLLEVLEHYRLRTATIQRNAPRLVSQLQQNMDLVLSVPSADYWDGRLKNIPCTLISAGPSLELALPYLSQLREKSLLFVVGTALRVLLDAGVQPDFVILADPDKLLMKQLPADCSNLKLIALPTVHPEVLERFPKKMFAWQQGIPELEEMAACYGKNLYQSGGSVSTLMLDIALRWNGNPLILIGQDLAFSPEGATHSRGTMYDNSYADVSRSIRVAGENGEEVYTTHSWKLFLRWIERRLENEKNVDVWNTSLKGSRIVGTKNRKIEDIVRELPGNGVVQEWRIKLNESC
ncbi:motility associated factor glycosyltransferase family protein [Effusibacillus dendaii]|uniref:DUF115 domain-containing protein n=1 Tax=Effusibacillus dendaii TaxID=2743772 RepID=A0A7I8DCQ2_9BACL|nr:6-hydroxymethylpterin diphosphokinase MptE-like protein [Effusibacillus dendaii]BCJ87874.1 hypothetical protein skT53_28590 [Effusibacillus dendaii]